MVKAGQISSLVRDFTLWMNIGSAGDRAHMSSPRLLPRRWEPSRYLRNGRKKLMMSENRRTASEIR